MRLPAASLLLAFCGAPSLFGAACASSFTPGTFCQALTIDHTKVGATDSSNFPVLVDLSAFAGHVLNASGFDIQFWSDTAASAALAWEIDFWDNSGKILWAWVKIPTVSHTADTTFYMTYNNPTISTFQSTGASVWTNAYDYVWHGGNGTVLGLTDSTSNANTATNSATPVTATTGQIAGGGAFVQASTEFLTVDTDPAAVQPATLTFSAWVNYSGTPTAAVLRKAGNGYLFFNNAGNAAIARVFDSGGNLIAANSAIATNTGTWHYLAATFDATASVTNALKFYVDNQTAVQANAVATGNIKYTAGSFQIGAQAGLNSWNGSIDEVHVSTGVRSADWVTAEFNNQNAPGTFTTAATEQRTRVWGMAMMGMQ